MLNRGGFNEATEQKWKCSTRQTYQQLELLWREFRATVSNLPQRLFHFTDTQGLIGIFVIATGVQHSVRDFVNAVAGELGMRIGWQGTGEAEEGLDIKSGRRIVAIDPRYLRPAEVDTLQADPGRARRELEWAPRTSFAELVRMMVDADLERVS